MSLFVTVYDKGHDLSLPSKPIRVVPLLNKGREGRTWLSHVIRHWDDLADWTYLAQGEPHQDPEEFERRLAVEYFDTTALTREYLPHFPPKAIKDQDVVEWHGGCEVRYGRAIFQGGRTPDQNESWLREVWGRFFTCPPPEPLSEWTYGYAAMYAVPRHRIKARPLSFWRWCHRIIAQPEHQAEHSWGSGYAFEVIWRYLFGDADLYPVRIPELDRIELGMLAEQCPHGSKSCGCEPEVPRSCSHPDRPDKVRLSDCLLCVSQSSLFIERS